MSSCSSVRAVLGEPVLATAPPLAASWLLVEHPGPWPSVDLPPDLPPAAAAVVERATALGVRPQLVRTVRARRRSGGRIWTASVRPGKRWLQLRDLADLAQLAELDVDALARGERAGFGSDSEVPVLLVCTHGRRDVCCARLGRPAATALSGRLPATVLETTHVGGDRFAPNLVALPFGSYHGAMADPPAVAVEALAGRVVLEHFRGRAGLPRRVQAADWFLRRELGVLGLDDVRHAGERDGCVLLEAGGTRYAVDVRETVAREPRLTSCAEGGTTDTPPAHALVGIRVLV
jgi:hypothetical protein